MQGIGGLGRALGALSSMRKVINQGPKYAEQETIRFESALGNSRMCRAAASLPDRATHTDHPPLVGSGLGTYFELQFTVAPPAF